MLAQDAETRFGRAPCGFVGNDESNCKMVIQ